MIQFEVLVDMVQRANRRGKRQENEIERLEKEIRELKAINRSLLKQLKKLSKGINKDVYNEALNEVENGTKKEKDDRAGDCPECNRKALKEVVIAGRLFYRCSICEYKSGVIKK